MVIDLLALIRKTFYFSKVKTSRSHCLLAFCVLGPCCVVQYLASFLVLQSSCLGSKRAMAAYTRIQRGAGGPDLS